MLQPIQVDFGRGIASAMGNASENVKNIGDIARNYLATEERKKTRAEDVAYRDQQAAQAKEQFNKQFGLQQSQDVRAQAQEGRAVSDDLMKRNTREAYAQADTLLGAPGMTQAQAANVAANPLLARAQAEGRALTPKEEAAIAGQANKNIKANTSLLGQRQLLMEQAPVKELYTPQADGTVLTRTDIDPTSQIALKEARIGDIDKKLAAEELYAQQMNMLRLKEAGDNARLNKTLATKETKFSPYTVTVGYDSAGKYTSDPAKIAHKSTINVNSPAIESAVSRQYGVKNMQLGTLADYIPNQRPAGTGTGKGSSDKLFEEVAGTSSYLGGTDKYDLAIAADALKADYPKVPKGTIDNLVAQSSKGGLTDSINLTKIKQQLDTYK